MVGNRHFFAHNLAVDARAEKRRGPKQNRQRNMKPIRTNVAQWNESARNENRFRTYTENAGNVEQSARRAFALRNARNRFRI